MHQIIYPNLEGGNSKSLENYILEVCNQHKEENRALAFAFIISASILFFQVKDNNIIDYTFAQIRKEKIEEAFNKIKGIIKTAIDSLKDVKSENRHNSVELFNLIKGSIESSEFWKNAQTNFDKLIRLKDFLLFWKI